MRRRESSELYYLQPTAGRELDRELQRLLREHYGAFAPEHRAFIEGRGGRTRKAIVRLCFRAGGPELTAKARALMNRAEDRHGLKSIDVSYEQVLMALTCSIACRSVHSNVSSEGPPNTVRDYVGPVRCRQDVLTEMEVDGYLESRVDEHCPGVTLYLLRGATDTGPYDVESPVMQAAQQSYDSLLESWRKQP